MKPSGESENPKIRHCHLSPAPRRGPIAVWRNRSGSAVSVLPVSSASSAGPDSATGRRPFENVVPPRRGPIDAGPRSKVPFCSSPFDLGGPIPARSAGVIEQLHDGDGRVRIPMMALHLASKRSFYTTAGAGCVGASVRCRITATKRANTSGLPVGAHAIDEVRCLPAVKYVSGAGSDGISVDVVTVRLRARRRT